MPDILDFFFFLGGGGVVNGVGDAGSKPTYWEYPLTTQIIKSIRCAARPEILLPMQNKMLVYHIMVLFSTDI